MKTILITGGCGYVGSRVAKRLVDDGLSVVVADKATPEERGVSLPDGVEFRHGDLRIPDNCTAALQGVTHVLHLAANIGSLTYMHDHQAEIIQENSAIDASLYQAIVEYGKVESIMYSSSSMIYQKSSKYPYTEEDAPDIKPPTNVYGFSKLAGEYFCRAYKQQFDLDYTIIRYHNIYGPGEDSKGSSPGDIHVIPALIEKIIVKKQDPLEILGNPEATRPFTYVDDAVDATVRLFHLMLNKDERVMNTDFNIGNPRALRILDLAKIIWDLLVDGKEFNYEIVKTNAVTAIRREVKPDKLIDITGWKPAVSLEDGILNTAEWIKSR